MTSVSSAARASPVATSLSQLKPEAVAAEVAKGLRRRAETIWAPAPLRWVMLALRLLPRAVFRRLPI